ncbi:FIST signal transduction protein [Mariniflexile jejuense]|uniref:FIST signal transduction protein n=1 Tax=Mariniflexile jejuense TaxID=1173582 RepID=A0ABW3JEP0_9FLAO
MKIVQLVKHKNKNWQYLTPNLKLKKPLVLVFGNRFQLEEPTVYNNIKTIFPDGHIVFASTSGNITSQTIEAECITITAIELEKSSFKVKTINLSQTNLNSFDAGVKLVNQLKGEHLKYILVISDGSFVNGSELTKGMNWVSDNNVLITGGLCGDDARFERTLVAYNENPKDGEIVAIGFYGATFEASSSVYGGWQPFGPERIVTKAKGNILYELDHQPALNLYKRYLGEKSAQLPLSALYYPLKVTPKNEDHSYVRTILNISEEHNAMIFAGDIPVDAKVQLMMTNVESLAKASEEATKQALVNKSQKPDLAILVSCIGRKLVLDQRAIEEVEESRMVLNNAIPMCGFYSYGEIAPFNEENMCQLHNQSMAITLISE